MVHGVDAVGGDVHLEEGAVRAEIEDAFDGDAAEGEIVGELTVGDREFGEIGTKPIGENAHSSSQRVSESASQLSRTASSPFSILPIS